MTKTVLALLTMLVAVGLASPAASNTRQLAADSVEVTVTSMTPLNPQPGKTLRISGRMRNRSNDELAAIQVRLLLSSTPMATRSEIGTVVAGGSERDGPPTLAVSEPVPTLLPRNSADWSLEIPLDLLPLNVQGVYVVGLEVIGTGTDGLTQGLGLTRSFLPWFPEGSVTPTRLAWLWPVTAAPDRALDEVQLSEQTAAEMAPGGRLARIIAGAGTARITWVFDPAVLQTAEDMIEGYEVVAGPVSSQLSAGSGSAVAQSWLTAVRQAAANQDSIATAYGFVDATALQRADMSKIVVEATSRAVADVSAETRSQVDGVMAWPGGLATTPSTMRTFKRAGATDLLLSDTSFPATPGLTYTPDGFTTWAGLPVTLADSGVTAALAMPQDNKGESLLARQRFLAEVAMSAGELPDQSRSLVAAPDPLWAPSARFLRQTLRALDQAPYSRLISLKAARRKAVEVPRTRLPYSADQRATELPADYLAQVQKQQRAARRLQAVFAEPAGLGYDQSVMRQTSLAWRLDQTTGIQLVRTVSEQIARQTAQVRVATTGTFTLPGDTGRIPVTVANDLEQDVIVGIRLESDEPARLSAPVIAPFRVPAGRKVSLEVEAKVVGSGTLPVDIQLTTPKGRRYGQPVSVEVRTTAYSRAAAYVVSGAFVILAFLLAMNFVRRRRERRNRS
ncbi:MAG: DUF6049 family protein [Candidatus Nanopelagicales bacterium]